MAYENTTEPTKWERYDLARSRLSIMIDHYSELIHHEESRSTPDTQEIQVWEDLQDELSDRATMLSVDDLEAVERINVAYGSAVSDIMKV